MDKNPNHYFMTAHWEAVIFYKTGVTNMDKNPTYYFMTAHWEAVIFYKTGVTNMDKNPTHYFMTAHWEAVIFYKTGVTNMDKNPTYYFMTAHWEAVIFYNKGHKYGQKPKPLFHDQTQPSHSSQILKVNGMLHDRQSTSITNVIFCGIWTQNLYFFFKCLELYIPQYIREPHPS